MGPLYLTTVDYIDCLVLTMVTNGRFVIFESNDSPLFLTVALRIEQDFILFWFAVCHCLHSFYKAVCAQYVIILSRQFLKNNLAKVC